ncbi:endoglucanase [Streptosporangium becharense]|uniref:Glucanase n=1 Tax=Streptosporangium becharense TaxID=1816182 RepID=A0A7W9MEP9_9ACTN|nr:glycoside hydrolase family 6 protein [Streptosporangium becharense]MBB2913610.1 endoglucanase [Streptosporangium becharense]MBB5817691.1 endoglucanase [Streptosporangium becharense]
MNRYGLTVAVLALALAGSGCTGDPAPSAAPKVSDGPTDSTLSPPSKARDFYVDPDGAAAQEVRRLEAAGRTEEAGLIRKIADRPNAIWIGDPDPHGRVADITSKARQAGRVPVLVAYHIPNRDCGQFSAGGAASAAEYRSWIARFAEGIGDRHAWVVVEPDALAHILDNCTHGGQAGERLDLLRNAVETLKKQPNARVYVDAGNAGWIKNPDDWIEPMRRAGVPQADGFAFNVSNFFTVEESVAVAERLSKGLGGVRYVIDTSRNGNGPARGAQGDDAWCNPKGRALGTTPTTETGLDRVDAFLWVKRPGESDGECHRGEPKAGDWFPEYALELARNAK